MRRRILVLAFRFSADLRKGKKAMEQEKIASREDVFFTESNLVYLEEIWKQIQDGTAHFEEHDLIEE